MGSARNFVIYTRGRTGSTAIAAELGSHPRLVCFGELFWRSPLRDDATRERYKELGFDLYKVGDGNLVPYVLFRRKQLKNGPGGNEECYGRYLDFMVGQAQGFRPEAGVGFKLLRIQGLRHRGAWDALKDRNFAILHLIRRNLVRQVVSAMVARQRGVFSARNWAPGDEKYHLDAGTFVDKIEKRRRALDLDRALLDELGADGIDVYYEDFLADRQAFFSRILAFLGTDGLTISPSDYSVMTGKDLGRVIDNYEEIRRAAGELGLADMLEAP